MAFRQLIPKIAPTAFYLTFLPSLAGASSFYPVNWDCPEQMLSDPTLLHLWNLPLKIIILIFLSITIPTTLFIPIRILFSLSTGLYLGHKRVSYQNVLENKTRNAIYICIQENPGIHINFLSQILEMNIGTVRYHVGILCKTGKVVSEEQSCRKVRYYIKVRKYSELEKNIMTYLNENPKNTLIESIGQHPGITRKSLASQLAISGPGITWHMKSLIRDGIVRKERSGRSVQYFLSQDVKEYIITHDLWKNQIKVST